MVNGEKRGCFTPDERLSILESACKEFDNVKPIVWGGLAADLLRELDARFIVKGARNATDFDYEHSLSEIMRKFIPDCETIILPAKPELFHVSSTYARELLKHGEDLSLVADEKTAELMKKIYSAK